MDIAEEYYSEAYHDRFEQEEQEEELHECANCQSHMIGLEEHFCDKCKKHIQESYKTLMIDNYTKEEIMYIDTLIEGHYLIDYLGF